MAEETESRGGPRKAVRWTIAVLLAAAGIALIAFPNQVAAFTGYFAINDHAMTLIDDTLQRDQATFLVITGIKTSLAMVEGSNVGVGFQLQVGDVVQPAYDYVDFFWRMFLYAFMIMGFYKLLLETELLLLGLAVMGIGLVLLAIGLVARLPRLDAWLWGRRCLFGGLLFAYVAPLALIAAHALNQRYMAPVKERQAESIRALEDDLEASVIRFSMLRGRISLLQPGKSLEDLKNGMLEIVNEIGETVRLSLTAFLYYILVILFELVFFPFLSAFALYKFGQFALGRLVQAPATPAPVAAPGPAESTPGAA